MNTPTHHDPDQLAAVARAASKAAGCTCQPDLEVVEEYPGMHRCTVRHDAWCQLLARRSARWN